MLNKGNGHLHEADLQKLKVQIHHFILSRTRKAKYFKWSHTPAEEREIYENELLWIERAFDKFYDDKLRDVCSQEEQEQMKAEFIERAELWHELRQSGKNFPPEKMEKLFQLESAFNRGEVPYHLKRVNEDLGIIPIMEPSEPKIKTLKDWALETELERLKDLTEPEDSKAPKTKSTSKYREEGKFK